jgi:hypothetical protein
MENFLAAVQRNRTGSSADNDNTKIEVRSEAFATFGQSTMSLSSSEAASMRDSGTAPVSPAAVSTRVDEVGACAHVLMLCCKCAAVYVYMYMCVCLHLEHARAGV